jgi:hypothetical protein
VRRGPRVVRSLSQLVKCWVFSGKKGVVPPGWNEDADEFAELDDIDLRMVK